MVVDEFFSVGEEVLIECLLSNLQSPYYEEHFVYLYVVLAYRYLWGEGALAFMTFKFSDSITQELVPFHRALRPEGA